MTSKNEIAQCATSATNFEEFLQKLEKSQDEKDLKALAERDRQKWKLRARLNNRLHPKFNEQLIETQIAQTEFQTFEVELEASKEESMSKETFQKEFEAERNRIVSKTLEDINVDEQKKHEI